MNLFRSEENIARWLGTRTPGMTIPAQACDLAHAWWDTRLQPDWRPRTRDENQAILDRLGLTGRFWVPDQRRSEFTLKGHSRTLGQRAVL
jgi:hypothetical protein